MPQDAEDTGILKISLPCNPLVPQMQRRGIVTARSNGMMSEAACSMACEANAWHCYEHHPIGCQITNAGCKNDCLNLFNLNN
jgi:hypothetical protein